MISEIRQFLKRDGGSIAPLVGISLPILATAGFGAVEFADVATTRIALQASVDMAALKGARELGTDRSSATAERARQTADDTSGKFRPRWTVSTTASFDPNTNSVTVNQTASRPSLLTGFMPNASFSLSVTATGMLQGSRSLCVLGSRQNASDTAALAGSASLTATDCLVQSNSSINVGGASRIQAGAVRSVGAATGSIAPAPVTDAPVIPDPFAGMAIDVPNRCDDIVVPLPVGTTTLNPGVHCGVLSLLGGRIFLNPGEHYFVGGSFNLLGTTELLGDDVVVIFKGQTSLKFAGAATLSLDGRKSGPYAGFVMITDRSLTSDFDLSASNAKRLLGTIYLPNAKLNVSGSGNKVADQSPWTVVVADKIGISGSATLVINAAYYNSPVPLPQAIGSKGPVLSN